MASQASFKKWANKVKFDNSRIKSGMSKGWSLLERPQIKQITPVTAVHQTNRGDVFGMAMLGSNEFFLNPKNLGKNPLLWAATALHESVHAVNGEGEKEALDAEFKFLGSTFKKAVSLKNRELARQSVRMAIIANRQRERDVSPEARRGDLGLLTRSGFTESAARVILSS